MNFIAPKWSQAEDEALLDMRKQSKAWREIAHLVGRSTDATKQRFAKLMNPTPPRTPKGDEWTAGAEETLRKLWAEGLTCAQIGSIMERTRNAIIGKANRMKLPPRKAAPPRYRTLRLSKPKRKADIKSKRALEAKLVDRPEFKPAPMPKPQVSPLSRPVPQDARSDGECAYPLWGNDTDRNSVRLSCGAPTEKTYCEFHHKVMYHKPNERERPAPFVKRARLKVLLGERV